MPLRDPSDAETRRHTTSAEPRQGTVDLVVVEGHDAGKRVTVEAAGAPVLVGTGELCELRLVDPTISRRHASVELTALGTLVTDLGSTNGTYLGEVRVVAAYLTPGSRLRIGPAVLEVQASGAPPAKAKRAAALGRMASGSPRMINVLSLCEKLAPSAVPIVLEGETGTGKELLAESIHEASGRAAHPFVVLDCRTTPRELVEAYLFGEQRADGSVRAGIFERRATARSSSTSRATCRTTCRRSCCVRSTRASCSASATRAPSA
jgi:two-component system response regulator HydG